MTKWNNVSLGELLVESKIPTENPDPNKRITVKLNLEGVKKRPFKKEIKGATRYYIRKAGQFIYGKQNLHKGAFGIIPEELDGYESTIDLPSFDIDKSKVLPEWLMLIFTKDNFYKELEGIASGSATKRIHPEKLLQIKIPLPSISEQKDILEKYNKFKTYHREINNIIDDSKVYIDKLRQSILQDAVQGKLVPQDPEDEPASVLLEKIKEEKERLIKEKKIKKQKPLPPIIEDEIPYKLPKGWEWVRLGEICSYIQRGKSPKYSNVKEIPVISQKCIQWNGFDISKARFIEPESLIGYTKERFIEPFDLLWNSTGLGTLGRINIFPKNKPYDKVVADSHVTVIRPFKNFVYSKYLYIWFAGPIVQDEINDKSTGSTKQTELNITTVKKYIVPLPPLNEQKRIVEKVNQLMTLCDELEKNIEQSKKDSELLMKSVLQEAFKEA